MSAITEIPAKTPKPIGKTCSDRPGIWKAAADEVDGAVSSAAVADEGGDTALPNAPVGDGVSVPLTVVKPSATTTAPEPEPAEVEDPVVETASVADGAAERTLTVATTPSTLTAPPEFELVGLVEELEEPLFELLEDVLELVLVSPDVVVDEEELLSEVLVELEEPLELSPLLLFDDTSWPLTETWQFCTSCT